MIMAGHYRTPRKNADDIRVDAHVLPYMVITNITGNLSWQQHDTADIVNRLKLLVNNALVSGMCSN